MELDNSQKQKESGHDVGKFGPVLPIVADVGAGPTKGIEIQGDYAYAVSEGTLTIVEIKNANVPEIVGKLEGLGSSRQIQVRKGIAYIASRGDGLFLVDVSDPANPSVLSNHDTIEFATGIGLGGDIAFLACRLYGTELVDISDPHNPEHISLARTGVSQSVVYANGFLYVGSWGDKAVVVVDIDDPWDPVIVERLPLDGYGDGVAVYEGHLYAATGQHSRAEPRKKPGDPGYGTGHGLEIYSLIDPSHPQLVSRTKFPPEYHTDSHLWTVRVANDCAFVTDNYNGLFVLDISDPAQPTFVGHHQLPFHVDRDGPYVVSSVSVTEDYILIAGQYTDVHVIAAPGIASPVAEYSGSISAIGPRPRSRATEHYQAHYMDGQVYNVVCQGNVGYVAAGQGGLHLVEVLPEVRRIRQDPTKDRVMDVELRNDYLYVAEGTEGLTIWLTGPHGELSYVGRYRVEGEFIRQVIVPEPGRYALLMVGSYSFHIVDLQDPQKPVCLFKEHGHGFLTGDNIADGLISQRYVGVFWHKSGGFQKETDRVRWYDLDRSGGVGFVHETSLYQIKTANGVAIVGDQTLVVGNGGYRLIDELETRDFRDLPLFKLPDVSVIGKPTVYGKHLYISHRPGGEIFLLDTQDIAHPKLIDQFVTRGNPSRVVPHDNCLLIPGGYEGLLVCDLPDCGD